MTAETAKTAEPARLGRKRDHSRDPEILASALDVLAEVGYTSMTVDMVATRAKAGKATLYRRWPSKAELVVDAVACMKRPLHQDEDGNYLVPDTGTLRGDLVAMAKPKAVTDGSRHMKIMVGVASMLSSAPELLDSINKIMIEPRVAAYRTVFDRAVERGEIQPGADIELLAALGPAMGMFRAVYQQQPPSRDAFIHIIDTIVLPSVGLSAPAESAHE